MATTDLTAETFESTIEQNSIVITDWWADWCRPCKVFAPVFEQAAENHPEIVFGKVDTEAEQALAAQAGITGIPTLMVFRDQILIHRSSGALNPAQLEQLIAAVNEVDMDQVRQEIAEAESKRETQEAVEATEASDS